MFKINKALGLFLIGCIVLVISGCGNGQQKSETKKAGDAPAFFWDFPYFSTSRAITIFCTSEVPS